jgi:hypothetical protein
MKTSEPVKLQTGHRDLTCPIDMAYPTRDAEIDDSITVITLS